MRETIDAPASPYSTRRQNPDCRNSPPRRRKLSGHDGIPTARSPQDQPARTRRQPPGRAAAWGASDAAPVELQLQVAIEIDPKGAVIRATRWAVHRAVTKAASALRNVGKIPALRASGIQGRPENPRSCRFRPDRVA
jgi:hypothetical protein